MFISTWNADNKRETSEFEPQQWHFEREVLWNPACQSQAWLWLQLCHACCCCASHSSPPLLVVHPPSICPCCFYSSSLLSSIRLPSCSCFFSPLPCSATWGQFRTISHSPPPCPSPGYYWRLSFWADKMLVSGQRWSLNHLFCSLSTVWVEHAMERISRKSCTRFSYEPDIALSWLLWLELLSAGMRPQSSLKHQKLAMYIAHILTFWYLLYICTFKKWNVSSLYESGVGGGGEDWIRDQRSLLQIHLITGICLARGPEAQIRCGRGDKVG